jgi:hypothetical protein
MRALSTGFLSPGRRGPLVAIGLFVLVLLAAYGASQFILSGDTFGLVLIVAVAAAGAAAVAILNDWRKGLYIFLTWLLVEDLFRKFLGNNMAIYFGKNILAAFIYISFLGAIRRREVKTFRPPFLVPLLIFFAFGVVQVFNPASTHLIYGALGVNLYFYYIPLVFIGYALFESEADLRQFFSFNLVLAGVIGCLGILQAVLGHTFLNPSKPAEDIRELSTLYRQAPLSHALAYRPTSLFVSTGRFATYMVLAWLAAFGFGGYLLLRHRRGRLLAFLVLAITTLGVVMSSSRGAVLWTAGSALVGAAAFLWGAPWRQREAIRVLRLLQRTLLVAGIALAIFISIFPEQIGASFAFYDETLSPDSPASELVFRTRDYPLHNFLLAFDHPGWPYGYGIGTASLGVQYIARIFQQRSPVVGVENGYGTLVVELGIVGLILWILWTGALAISAWAVVRKLKGSPWFPLAFMIFWYAFLLLFPITYAGMGPYQDFVLNAYLWLLVGILYRLPHIALSAQNEKRMQAPSGTS